MELTTAQVRVLGCLMEKQVTTPDGYPLTVNSLRLACNQSTNRYPVLEYSDDDVSEACRTLREVGLTRIVYSPSNRAPKHRHIADEFFPLSPAEQSVMTVLLLRGPQTIGEIKSRTERMHSFDSLDAVEHCMRGLAERAEPLTVQLARRPGQKEERHTHLLSPVHEQADFDDVDRAATRPSDVASVADERFAELEARIEALETVVEQLRALLD